MGSANLGTRYNSCFSGIMVLRIYINNIVHIIRFANMFNFMFNLCFGFDLAWFGGVVQA